MHKDNQPLIFEITKEGRIGYSLPELDVPELRPFRLIARRIYP